jgi:signal transduction histidine kinase
VDAAFLQRIDSLARRLAHRVDDLVLLSTLDEQPPLHRQTVDVVDIVRAEAATMPSGGEAPSIEIVGAPTEWSVDERLLSRAVRNLMSNACRHAAHQVRVDVCAVDGTLSIDVADDGPGVPEPQRDFILRRFGRLDEARNSDGGGAGLGLAIVDSVVRAHGGDVVIGDSPLGGARLSMRLPNHVS